MTSKRPVTGAPRMSPTLAPSVSYTVTLRLEYPNVVGSLRRILTVISENGGDAGAIDILHKDRKRIVRGVTFAARDLAHAHQTSAPNAPIRA